MKTQIYSTISFYLGRFRLLAIMAFLVPALVMAMANGSKAAGSENNGQLSPEGEMRAAERQLEQAAEDFSRSVPAAQNSAQRTGTLSFSGTGASNNSQAQGQQPLEDPRLRALQGSPATGYAGTWTDPATGDIVTSVIAPAPAQAQPQSYPIIVEPQVSGWGGNSSSWPQWPGSGYGDGYGPGAPSSTWGYTPGANASVPPPPPPGPGFHPYPVMTPPPYTNGLHHGYRPLRPNPPPANPGGIWNPALPVPPGAGFYPGSGVYPQPGPGTPPPPPGAGLYPQPGSGTPPPSAGGISSSTTGVGGSWSNNPWKGNNTWQKNLWNNTWRNNLWGKQPGPGFIPGAPGGPSHPGGFPRRGGF